MKSRVKRSRERGRSRGFRGSGVRGSKRQQSPEAIEGSGNGLEEWSGIRPAQGLRFTGTTTGVYIPQEKELYSPRNRVQDYHKEYVGDW